MIPLPKEPTGKTRRSAWLRAFWQALRARTIIAGDNIVTEETPFGTRVHAKKDSAIRYRWTQICVDGEEKWCKVARSVVYDELPDGVEEPTE